MLCQEEEQEEGEEYGLEENSRRADGQGADLDNKDEHRRNAKRIALGILAPTRQYSDSEEKRRTAGNGVQD